MKAETWIKRNMPSLVGKTVAVSGATGGLGQELCAHLAALGANLLLLDRNSERSCALIERLQARFPSLDAKHLRIDLADFTSVASVTEQLKKNPPDVLILNAGAYHIPRYVCDTGYDNVFQINFLSPYYLASSLLPIMKEKDGRIVAVGSIAHNYSHADFEDVDFSKRTQSSKVYGNAKRWLMFSLFGLCDNSDSIAVVHPGITLTNITAHYPKWIYAIIKHPMKVIFMKPKRASLSILYGITEACDKNEWIGPSLFDIWGLPRKKRLKSCSEEEAATIFALAQSMMEELRTRAARE